jgi:hypothetical protein
VTVHGAMAGPAAVDRREYLRRWRQARQNSDPEYRRRERTRVSQYRERLREDSERYESYLEQQRARMEDLRRRKRVRRYIETGHERKDQRIKKNNTMNTGEMLTRITKNGDCQHEIGRKAEKKDRSKKEYRKDGIRTKKEIIKT